MVNRTIQTQPKPTSHSPSQPVLKIIPLGGCGAFGMNITAYVHRRNVFLVDAGAIFPEPKELGVSRVIPDLDKWLKDYNLCAYIITHGHDDHIGAMPYLLRKYPAPVYGTPWTLALIKGRMEELNLPKRDLLKTVQPGDTVTIKEVSFEYFPVNHSIPHACALLVRAGGCTIFHSGDFKIDPDPYYEKTMDLGYLRAVGKRENVQLMLTDSTNVHSPGPSPSERSVVDPLANVLKKAPGRVFITTFASNFWRLESISLACKKSRRKIVLLGRSIQNCYSLAMDLGIFNWPDGMLITERQAANYRSDELVYIATGCQAEPRSALWRICAGEHRTITIKSSDTVVFSSRVIPGNEKSIFALQSMLEYKDVNIVTSKDDPKIHVSGHAYRGDLQRVVQAVRPHYYVPIHGSFSHLKANRGVAGKISKVFEDQIIKNGDTICVDRNRVYTEFDPKNVINTHYVDSESALVMTKDVLKERLDIGELGGFFISGLFVKKTKKWAKGPRVQPIGLPVGEAFCQQLVKALKAFSAELGGETQDLTSDLVGKEIENFTRRYCMRGLKKRPAVVSQVWIT